MACTQVIDTHEYAIVPSTILEDDSFTVAYSIMGNSLPCFHDYVPDFTIGLRNNRLLQFLHNSMYEMNVGRKGSYFGIVYNCYITPVLSSYMFKEQGEVFPFIINSINWNTDIEKDGVRQLEETWNQISLHNSFQGTMEKILKPFLDNCTWEEQYGEANVMRVKNRWQYNQTFNEKFDPDLNTYRETIDSFIPINTEDKDCTSEELYKVQMIDDFIIARLLYNNLLNRDLFFYSMDFDITPVPL